MTDVRKGQAPPHLDRDEFGRRFRARFADPLFDAAAASVRELEELAWRAYDEGRKAPRTRAAGPGFADPSYQLSEDWLATRARLHDAARVHADPSSPSRVLLVCGSMRNDGTCPGEVSKSWRLVEVAKARLAAAGVEVDLLDLSLLTSEYGRAIHPCKACVSTAMPLCHWPCSCYPHHGLDQVGDWMAEIYERWTRAHGVLIVTPVYWYQAPAGLKAMIDRLVCADGGNPDPTSTGGKDAARAKAIELAGWGYPQHLAGRVFGLVVHGDAGGAEGLRRGLADWLTGMGLIEAGARATIDRYIDYYGPYATSHDALDDDPIAQEVGVVAAAVAEAVALARAGALSDPGASLPRTRPK